MPSKSTIPLSLRVSNSSFLDFSKIMVVLNAQLPAGAPVITRSAVLSQVIESWIVRTLERRDIEAQYAALKVAGQVPATPDVQALARPKRASPARVGKRDDGREYDTFGLYKGLTYEEWAWNARRDVLCEAHSMWVGKAIAPHGPDDGQPLPAELTQADVDAADTHQRAELAARAQVPFIA